MSMFSWGYLFFVIAMVALYWLVMPKKLRPYLLLFAGLFFVLYQPPKFFIVTAVYLFVTWYFGLLIHNAEKQSAKKSMLIIAIVFSVGLLAFYKYGGFFGDVHALSRLAGSKAKVNLLSGMAPLGLSYFVFRVIHYHVEIYKGKFPQANIADFALYVTFFPTIIAGPIDKFDQFQPQRVAEKDFAADDFYYGMSRIVQGLFKKLVISASLYQFVTPYYNAVGPGGQVLLTTGQLWLIHHVYFFYLYFDFSGYSDIAIGTARLFGYKIMENFNWPFLKPNIAAFWDNWHISLTRWLREYIYYPLGGNRKGFAKSVMFSFITMGAFGAWHGNHLHFILFGFYHALLISFFRGWRMFRAKYLPNLKPSKAGYVFAVLLTFEALNLGWPLFIHPFSKALAIYAKTFGMDLNIKLMMIQLFQAIR